MRTATRCPSTDAKCSRLPQRALGPGRRDVDRVVGRDTSVEDVASRARRARGRRRPGGRRRRRSRLGERSSTASTSTPGTRAPTAGAISSCSVRSRAYVVRHLGGDLLSKKMGATRAHFSKPVKCGRPRIAPSAVPAGQRSAPEMSAQRAAVLRLEHDRHGTVVHERDHHPGAEDASRDRHAFALERRAEPLVERLGELGVRGLREARRLPFRVSAMSVNWLTTSAPPPVSRSERSKRPSSFSNTRSRAIRAARRSASASRSPRGDSEENGESRAARGDDFAVHGHGRRPHTLHDSPHDGILSCDSRHKR